MENQQSVMASYPRPSICRFYCSRRVHLSASIFKYRRRGRLKEKLKDDSIHQGKLVNALKENWTSIMADMAIGLYTLGVAQSKSPRQRFKGGCIKKVGSRVYTERDDERRNRVGKPSRVGRWRGARRWLRPRCFGPRGTTLPTRFSVSAQPLRRWDCVCTCIQFARDSRTHESTMAMALLTFLTSVAFLASSGLATTPQTIILKCCKHGEELFMSENAEPKCVASSAPWEPFIYSPSQQKILTETPSDWIFREATRPNCRDGLFLTHVPYSTFSPYILFETGEAYLDAGRGANFTPSEYCVDSKALLACMAREADRAAATMRPTVRRCCGENAEFHEEMHTCISQNDPVDAAPLLPNISSIVDLQSGFPHCHHHSDNFTIMTGAQDAILQPDGGLKIDGISLPAGQYCVERIKELGGKAKVFACAEYAPHRTIPEDVDAVLLMYPISIIISAIFLAATLAAGWLLPASHHVLHWRCQTHHVVCLMLGDLLMAVIQLASGSLPGSCCKLVAIMAHFFFLAAFFWLNTMCFNIWWTFRDLRPASLEKGQETLRLRLYGCYAWGLPLLVAGLAALLDHLPPRHDYNFLRPRFGEKKCWFYGDNEILAYFYGPIGVLLAINIMFFIATARELTCGLWKGEFVKSTTERAALGRVCLKLVIVMGVTWIADVMSWAIGGPQSLWYFTDLLNALQGLFIFIVVGWQPQVRAGLKRLFNRNPRANAGRQGNGLSTTSHGMPSIGDSVTQNPSTKTAPLETIC